MTNKQGTDDRADVETGLYRLAQLIDKLNDCALEGDLAVLSCVLRVLRGKVRHILKELGTPFANTNSNSSSKKDLKSRSSNSNSKRRETPAGGARVRPAKRQGEKSTSTKYEEQAP